jgi:NitT/TauT family transport system substrate-binding protein
MTLEDGKKVFAKAPGLGSLYGSSKIADEFNIKYDVYKDAQNVDAYIDGSLTMGK